MGKTIAIVNAKGGTAKTATCMSILSYLTAKGYKSLGIDIDSQANMSRDLGGNMDAVSLIDVLTKDATAEDAIQKVKSCDIIVSSGRLASIDRIIPFEEDGREYRLKECLEPIKGKYDYIIIDCPPACGTLTALGLIAADFALIPLKADYDSLQGFNQISQTIVSIKQYCNHELKVAGVLLTMFNNRSKIHTETMPYIEDMASKLNTTIFNTKVRYSLKVAECVYSKVGIFGYAPKSAIANDYKAFTEELIERTSGNE